MLARAQRLTEKRDFQALFSRGVYVPAPLYTLRWQKSAAAQSRFGFVVANTVSKKATQRNTIRRRFRESVRRHQHIIPFTVDACFIVKPTAVGAPFKRISDEILRSFQSVALRAAPRVPTGTSRGRLRPPGEHPRPI